MKTLLLLGLLAGPTLAEKTGTARPPLATPPAMEGCDAADLGFVAGKPFDESLKARAMDGSGAATVRVFRTGDMLSQDLRADRLNIELGPDGRVVSARCG